MKTLFKNSVKIALFLIASFTANMSAAQTTHGEIRGKVTDKATKEILDFATIVLKQEGIVKASTLSDENGEYTLKGLNQGIYSMEVSYISYKKLIMLKLEVKAGQITFFNVQLEQIKFDHGHYIRIQCPANNLIYDVETRKTLRSQAILKLPIRD